MDKIDYKVKTLASFTDIPDAIIEMLKADQESREKAVRYSQGLFDRMAEDIDREITGESLNKSG